MRVSLALAIRSLCSLVLTILLYVLVFPEHRKDSLHKFFLFVKDLLDIKYMIIEKVARFVYVLETLFCICFGFFLLFARTYWYEESTALYGLLLIVLGPIACRLLYESFMLVILLVRNTMEIGARLQSDVSENGNPFDAKVPMPEISFSAPVHRQPQAPYGQPDRFQDGYSQPQAGYAWDPNQGGYAPPEAGAPAGVCPQCGTVNVNGSIYCAGCGTKLDTGNPQ